MPLLVLAGCAGGDGSGEEGSRIPGRTLTVYASLPRHGDSARRADAVAAGQRLALADAGGRAAGYRVRLVELDSSDPEAGGWDPAAVEANAGRAADDPTAIAYLGELDLGGSAISVPVTNEAGILQVSPGDGLTSLTRVQPGIARVPPERYYPSGRRTFVRLVPADLLQATALVSRARAAGARSVAILHDDHVFGRNLAVQLGAAAKRRALAVISAREVRRSDDGYEGVGRRLAEEGPDAVVYAGRTGVVAAPLLADLARALPGTPLLAASGVANPAFAGADGPAVLLLTPVRPARTYPAAGRRVLRRLAAQRGGEVPADALYGYEAMRLVLDAIVRAGAGDRAGVVRAALAARRRRSVIGTYAVRPNGDVSETRFAGYRRAGGRLLFEGLHRPGG